MSKAKVYFIDDLFFTSWKDLDDITHARVFALQQSLSALQPSDPKYGYALIACLRLLRKRPLLVDKINVPQAVDIYNDLKFLREPWYYFPEINHELTEVKPAEQLERTTFDEFIYADNEFSSFLINQDKQYLRRLVVTLYRNRAARFDKSFVEVHEKQLVDIDEELLMLVFFTYAHVREFVMKRCKTLLPPAGKSEDDNAKRTPTGGMWHQIKHQAVRSGTFGDFEKIGQHNMYDVLDHLEILCKEQDEKKK